MNKPKKFNLKNKQTKRYREKQEQGMNKPKKFNLKK